MLFKLSMANNVLRRLTRSKMIGDNLSEDKRYRVVVTGEIGVFKGYLSGLPVRGILLEINGEYRAFSEDAIIEIQ